MRVACCIVGGGPAGVMLGYLLARKGIEVVVLEKHQDFLRDFRGDTVHASTLQVLDDLGLLEKFLQRPHQEYTSFAINVEGHAVRLVDFKTLPTTCKFVAFMPQWDFLDFLADEARNFPTFHLMMETEAVDLITEGEKTVGVRALQKGRPIKITADLVVACDGRASKMRECASLHVKDLGVPIDVLWMKIEKTPDMPGELLAYVKSGKFLVLIDRGEYFQAGYLIAKGGFPAIKDQGLPAFRAALVSVAPFLAATIERLADWDQVKLLTVQIDRLEDWSKDGLLCIGDAAHAMSPAGGVGINLAIQDAVAAANILAEDLLRNSVSPAKLADVQSRREWPTKVLQAMQVAIHRRFLHPGGVAGLGTFLNIVSHIPFLRPLLSRLIAMGPRMERVKP